MKRSLQSTARWMVRVAAAAAGAYLGYAGYTWLRYGHPSHASGAEQDALLDRVMPDYEVCERHHILVRAPAAVTLAAAREIDMQASPIVRAIFRGREWAMGGKAETRTPLGFLDEVERLGWGRLAEVTDREIVMGAVTQPWLADVVFRPLAPEAFASFREPGYARIAWTLRVDPLDEARCVFRTETRVATTDPISRARFRRYWAFASPGIVLIRRLLLGPIRREAERRAAIRP